MTAQEYIESRLRGLGETPDVKTPQDLKEAIFQVIMSKKFRKFSVAPEYVARIREVIDTSIQNNAPISFSFPFGAYKLWRLAETPEADWAELFTLMHKARWLMPITKIYGPGVHFDFASDEVIIARMNNIPQSDIDAYAKSFLSLFDFVGRYLPQNFKFTLTPIRSLYTPEEFELDLADKMKKMSEEFGGLPVLDDEARRSVELNVKLLPDQDADPLWREKVELMHQAYYTVSRRRPYNRAANKILTFCMKLKDGKCVTVGTTKTSTAKFWVGVGALKPEGDRFREYVLSPSQLQAAQYTEQPIAIKELSGKNFNSIRILS